MDYEGVIGKVLIGRAGLITDMPQGETPSAGLLTAKNVSYLNGYPEKAPGALNYNRTALPSAIVGVADWWPLPLTQRLISVCRNGKVYRHTNIENYAEVTPSGAAPTTLNTGYANLVPCGEEEPGNDRKLLIFTGRNPVQVIVGDATTRRDIATPAADWTGIDHPYMAVLFRGAVWALGNSHRIYKSSETDHEIFQGGTALQFDVYPGDGERLISAFIFRKKLFLVKYPNGLYVLNDSDADAENWYFEKLLDSFGGRSPKCAVAVKDDVLIQNSHNSLTSVQAAFQLGEIATTDVFEILRNKNGVPSELAIDDFDNQQGIWYKDKQEAIFTFKSLGQTQNDRTCVISYKDPSRAKVSWNENYQANCLALMKDDRGIDRPIYGAEDGYVYMADREDRSVTVTTDGINLTSEGFEFLVETPHINFGELNPLYAEQNKNFDWVEVTYIPTGKWTLTMEVFIDGKFHKKMDFSMDGSASLDSFKMDLSRLSSEAERTGRKVLGGSGCGIAFKCYNSTAGQNVKLVNIRVGFQVGNRKEE
jgi:hypothetical protein